MSANLSLPVKHFLQFKDLNREELEYLFERTRIIKQKYILAALGSDFGDDIRKGQHPHPPIF
jgi:ornithine carbamoyltransferase